MRFKTLILSSMLLIASLAMTALCADWDNQQTQTADQLLDGGEVVTLTPPPGQAATPQLSRDAQKSKSSQNWSMPSTLTGGGMSLCGFIVKPGKTFTVKGMLTMGQNAKIVVERGAKLIVDGGTITGLPGFTWQGIEVWGDSSKTQANNGIYQGIAKFVNYSVVENAKVGAVTIRIDGAPNYAYTGGIIQATDATFRNCTYGVVFYKYENRNPLNNKPLNNASAFTRVIFETNNNYVGTDTIRNF
ncbi:MAG: hypothetical protein HGA93_01685, partial [Methanothrix sp.]|nr:hypothetical protein [Methanothrix sp.]